MAFLSELWLPIVLSAVFVFIVSSIIHMVLPIHRNDHQPIPNEDKVLQTLRDNNVGGGQYSFPHCSDMKEYGSEEMQAKIKQGPVGFMTVLPGQYQLGKSLLAWFIYTLVVGVFVAYIAAKSQPPADEYMTIFQITGAIAVLAYGTAPIPDSVWRGIPWKNTFKHVIDGVIYGLVTAGTFAWLW